MATASITITVTDSTVTLIDFRDTLCAAWGYTGAPTDNVAKLDFIKANLIAYMRSSYKTKKQMDATIANATIDQGISAA